MSNERYDCQRNGSLQRGRLPRFAIKILIVCHREVMLSAVAISLLAWRMIAGERGSPYAPLHSQ
jgi:hypothetical protein